ncbi:MAG: hypothetical protein JOZ11_09500 [Alphaproteobacteria bacterium]|nr:hypothetical protein [Alphaproteobacteria bacterium]
MTTYCTGETRVEVVDREIVRRQKLAELCPGRGVAEAADQPALMVDYAHSRSQIRNVAADGCGWTDFAM